MTPGLRISSRCLLASLATMAIFQVPLDAAADCVWRPPDSSVVGAGIAAWYGEIAGQARKPLWSLSAGGEKMAIKLGEGADAAVVEVLLAPDCTRSVRTTWAEGATAWFDDEQAGRLAAGLGLESVHVKSGGADGETGRRAGPDPVKRMSPLEIALIIVALGALLLAFIRRRDGRGPLVVDTILLVSMMLLAAWPFFPVPFTQDSQVLRYAFAAKNVFGDWNHPFLPYLLNRPAALLSSDPVVLRILPFCWALLEAFLFSLAARKIAGRPAAVLVGVWMASSLRITVGMIELSDWNLAGASLALMLLWLMRSADERPGRGTGAVAAVLILFGCFSSYLMIVPSAVLAGVLVVDWLRGRTSVFQPALAVAALLFAGKFVIDVFSLGSAIPRVGFTDDLPGMLKSVLFDEPPLGHSIAMPFLVAGGFLVRRFIAVRKAWWFSVATLVASVGALSVALVLSAINGAYYFALCKGLAYLSAALLVVAAVDWISAQLARVGAPRWVSAGLVPAILVSAVFFATFRMAAIPRGTEVEGIGHLTEFVDRTGRGETRVLSNDFNARVLMLYSEVMDGRMDIGVVLDDQAETWVHRTVSRFGVDEVDCSRLPSHFLLLWRNLGGAGTDERCRPMETDDCVELFVDPGMKACPESKRAFCYYECHRMTEAGSDGGAR